jgi:hypothetical protein
MLIVVKLNTPLSGTWIVWLVVGENAPSAPVDPLLKLLSCARAGAGVQTMHRTKASTATGTRFKVSFENIAFVLLFQMSVGVRGARTPRVAALLY